MGQPHQAGCEPQKSAGRLDIAMTARRHIAVALVVLV